MVICYTILSLWLGLRLCSSGDENVGCLEVLTEASNSTSSTTRLQSLLDALKLAACLGVVTKLLWGKRAQLLASGQKAQSGLTGQAVECLAPPTKQYSKAGFSSLNNDVGAPSVKVGGLSTPLGMAIATVMAEVKNALSLICFLSFLKFPITFQSVIGLGADL